MTISQRLKLVVKWLVANGIAGSQKEIGFMLGYKTESSFSQILNGKVPIPKGLIEKTSSLHSDINTVWIETGDGDMIKAGRDNNIRNIRNTGTVSGSMITGDGNNILAEKDQRIQLLENEVKYLKEIIAEKERFIQALLNK